MVQNLILPNNLYLTFNGTSLLQAYSVYDEEVGYCQGLSFLSAVLLLHVSHSCYIYMFFYQSVGVCGDDCIIGVKYSLRPKYASPSRFCVVGSISGVVV